jgi:hypothetical protein
VWFVWFAVHFIRLQVRSVFRAFECVLIRAIRVKHLASGRLCSAKPVPAQSGVAVSLEKCAPERFFAGWSRRFAMILRRRAWFFGLPARRLGLRAPVLTLPARRLPPQARELTSSAHVPAVHARVLMALARVLMVQAHRRKVARWAPPVSGDGRKVEAFRCWNVSRHRRLKGFHG